MTQVRLHLDDLAYNGAAVGRNEGKAVFVPGGIPGEEVLVEVVEQKPRYARGRLLEVLSPSPERVAPPCHLFGVCGGCQWQHISYDAQLRHKQGIVRSQLQRIGGVANPPVPPVIGMSKPWAYRNNVQFVVDGQGRLCLLGACSNQRVPAGDCRLLCPELSDVAGDLVLDFPGLRRVTLRAGRGTGERMLVLETTGGAVPELDVDRPLSCVLLLPDGSGAALVGNTYFHEEVGGLRLRVSAGSFFQINTEQAGHLLRLVQELAGVQPGQTVLDAYGGVGTFGLALAGQARQVIILEADPSAVADARVNAAGVPNVTVVEGAVEGILPTLDQHIDVAVLDPPRAGVAPPGLDALVERRPGRVVYVSCDPGSLARDVRYLLARGYELEVAQPVDMFPQTYHIESVALMMPA